MRFIEQFQKGAEKLAWVFFTGSVVAIFCLFVLIFADMTLRTTISLSIEGGIESSEYLLVAIGFLGLGYAQLKGGHVNVDVLTLALSPRTQRVIKLFILLALIVFFLVMGQQIARDAYISWATQDYRSGTTLLIPTWPPKFVACMGTGMLVLSFIVQLTAIIMELFENRISREGG